jgi:hypothetical protein
VLGSNRVSAEVELNGLDVPEMGVPGYPEFLSKGAGTGTTNAEASAGALVAVAAVAKEAI